MFAGLVVALLVSPQVLVVATVVAVVVLAVVRWTHTPWWAPLAVTLPILGIALLVRDQPLHDVAVMTRRFFQAGFMVISRGRLSVTGASGLLRRCRSASRWGRWSASWAR